MLNNRTGNQGSSVIREIAALNKFRVRALTRNQQGSVARQLKEKYGEAIEFIEGSYLERSSLERLFDGAEYAFILTNFWVRIFIVNIMWVVLVQSIDEICFFFLKNNFANAILK